MAIDLTKQKPGIAEHGNQRPKLPIDEAGGYTGTQTLYMTYAMRELLISNDDASASLTVQVTSDSGYTITITVNAGEILDERFYPFNQVIVTGTGAWRYFVRSGLIT